MAWWRARAEPAAGRLSRTRTAPVQVSPSSSRIFHNRRPCGRAGGIGGGGGAAGVVGPFECAPPTGRRFTKSRVAEPVAPPPPSMTGPARLAPNRRERSGLELGDTRAGAILVLLGSPAAGSARALHHAIPDDRHRALAWNHVPALGGHDALDDGTARPLCELAAGSPEGDGGDGLALGAVGPGPDGAVHAIEGHQTPARIADGHADPDVELLRLVDRALHNPVRFREGESHRGLL